MSSPVAMIVPAAADGRRNTEIAESLATGQVIGPLHARHSAIGFNDGLRIVVHFRPGSRSWLYPVRRRFAALTSYCQEIKDSRH